MPVRLLLLWQMSQRTVVSLLPGGWLRYDQMLPSYRCHLYFCQSLSLPSFHLLTKLLLSRGWLLNEVKTWNQNVSLILTHQLNVIVITSLNISQGLVARVCGVEKVEHSWTGMRRRVRRMKLVRALRRRSDTGEEGEDGKIYLKDGKGKAIKKLYTFRKSSS